VCQGVARLVMYDVNTYTLILLLLLLLLLVILFVDIADYILITAVYAFLFSNRRYPDLYTLYQPFK